MAGNRRPGILRLHDRLHSLDRALSGGGIMSRTERKPEQKKYDLDEVAKKMLREMKAMKMTVGEVRTVTGKIRKEALKARL